MKIQKFISKSPIVPTLICSRLFESHLHRAWAGEKVTVWEGLILTTLFFEDGTCRPSEVARTLRMSRSQLSQILKRLSAAGLINRELSPMNGRAIHLSLSTKGRRLAMKAIKGFDELSQKIDGELNSKFSEVLAGNLLKLSDS